MPNDAIFLLENGVFIDCNNEAEQMFGVSLDQLLHKAPQFYSPEKQPGGRDSRDMALEKIRMAAAGDAQSFEWQHRRSDGSLFDAEVNLSQVNLEGRSILLAMVRDITERKKTEEISREMEQMFRAIVENSHAGIFAIDDDFRITYANGMTGEMLARSNEEIVGHDFREMLDEESIKIVADRYMRQRLGEEVPSRYEFNIVQKNGNKRRVEISSTIFRTTSGNLRTVGQVLDITERKKADDELRLAHEKLESRVEERTAELKKANLDLQSAIAKRILAEEAMRESESKYRHLVQSANTIILEMDAEGKVTFFNNFAREFFGFQESEIIGKSVVGTIVPATDSAGKDLQAMIDDIVKNPEKYLHNENENVLRNGERVWIVWTNQPLYDESGRLKEILCIGIDRTEQKRGEELLARQAKERAAVEERNRLARDLHDAVSQTLFSASIIAEVLPRLWERDESEGRKRLEEVRELTKGALAEMRTLLLELRPAALMEAELGYLLNQLAESATGRSRVPVNVSVHGRSTLSPEVKVALYRIAQEALNNTAKHAAARRADVVLNCDERTASLKVSDDGSGFDAKAVRHDSLGMGIMRERARQIGARLSIHSRAGRGTTVSVVWKNKSLEAKQ